MTQLQPQLPGASPFDAIRQVRSDGSEFWSARRMQPRMGYAVWRDFANAIERAKLAAENTGVDVGSAFVLVAQLADARNLGDQQRYDYELSRYAAYLVAMNGDPRKPEIAAAQTYFAVRTREAEIAKPREMTRLELIDMARDSELARIDAENRAAYAELQMHAMEPAARFADEFMVASGDYSVREAAQILSRDARIETGQQRLFRYLREIGWLGAHNLPYQRQIDLGRMAVRVSTYEHPHHDGEEVATRQARVTPKGLAELHKLLGGGSQLPALMSEEVSAA